MPLSNFEPFIVNAINSFFAVTNQHGFAYRLKQSKFREQYVDVLVDSPVKEFSAIAIECKSVEQFRKNAEVKTLYFSGGFTEDKKGEHQVERITKFCRDCGRRGFLAVRIQRGKGRKSSAHFLPWTVVNERFTSGEKGILLEEIQTFPRFWKVDGVYNFDHVIKYK